MWERLTYALDAPHVAQNGSDSRAPDAIEIPMGAMSMGVVNLDALGPCAVGWTKTPLYLLGCLVKNLVASLCKHTSEVCTCSAKHCMVGFKARLSFYATGG